MKSSVYIYITLAVCIYVIICSILYISISGFYQRRKHKKIYKSKKQFKDSIVKILNDIKKNVDIDDGVIFEIKKKLAFEDYEYVFNEAIIQFNEDIENIKYTKIFMEEFKDYIDKIIKKYKLYSKEKKIHIIVLLGNYGVYTHDICEFLIDKLKKNSLYMRFNVLSSLSLIGNVDFLIAALLELADVSESFNDKIFIDVINQFTGDKEKLEEEFIKKFEKFHYKIQISIIANATYNKSDKIIDQMFFLLLNDKTDMEMKLSIIKYFGAVKFIKVKDILINFMNSSLWEVRAVVARNLDIYIDCEGVEDVLIDKMCDENWYVRFNSAYSVVNHINYFEVMEKIKIQNDKYSRDIMFYVLLNKKIIDYEEYLELNPRQEIILC